MIRYKILGGDGKKRMGGFKIYGGASAVVVVVVGSIIER